MPRGVTWSNTMRIHRGVCSRDGERNRVKAAGGKFKYRLNLLPRDVELLDDLVYVGSGFEVSNTAETGIRVSRRHPCAAQPSRHAFNGGALRPSETRPDLRSFFENTL